MTIDFAKEEGRRNYLQEKMDDLLDGINDSYGKVLLDELIHRLEQTVADFNEEVQDLMNQLHENSSHKDQLLKQILMHENERITDAPEVDEPVDKKPELSEWERRLESLSK